MLMFVPTYSEGMYVHLVNELEIVVQYDVEGNTYNCCCSMVFAFCTLSTNSNDDGRGKQLDKKV